MQLDTHVRNLLDMFANSGQPKIWELAPAEARNMALALTQMVEGKEPIGKIENGSLPGPEGALPFRMYTPSSCREQRSHHSPHNGTSRYGHVFSMDRRYRRRACAF
jgi:hypothetical protein